MNVRSFLLACSAPLKEAGIAHGTLELAIERVLVYLRSDSEVELRERRLGTAVAAMCYPTMQPIWCEVCEERLLAHCLVELQMVEQLRDRDEDAEYWRRRWRLECQVLSLGGNLLDSAYTASEDAEHQGWPETEDLCGLNAVIREMFGRSMSELGGGS